MLHLSKAEQQQIASAELKPLDLHPHNARAYASIIEHLDHNDRTCVLHATGLGKSFLALRFIKDHPDDSILFVSSHVLTLIQFFLNLHVFIPDYHQRQNVNPVTYDSLSTVTGESYQYLILDEFHHVALNTYEAAVQAIIARNPGIKLLGFTATAIRTTPRMDVSISLFGGDIASEITLYEAIREKIVPCPHYYRISWDLAVSDPTSIPTPSECERRKRQYLCEFPETLISSLHDLFKTILTETNGIHDPHGRYIIFCSSIQRLEMIEKACTALFAFIDTRIILFKDHSLLSSRQNGYDSFINNEENDCLRLLLVVDRLNEGLHNKRISGIFMFRSTDSQIVFMQQLGRVVFSGSTIIPLVVDIVDNISHLGKPERLSSSRQKQKAADQDMSSANPDSDEAADVFTYEGEFAQDPESISDFPLESDEPLHNTSHHVTASLNGEIGAESSKTPVSFHSFGNTLISDLFIPLYNDDFFPRDDPKPEGAIPLRPLSDSLKDDHNSIDSYARFDETGEGEYRAQCNSLERDSDRVPSEALSMSEQYSDDFQYGMPLHPHDILPEQSFEETSENRSSIIFYDATFIYNEHGTEYWGLNLLEPVHHIPVPEMEADDPGEALQTGDLDHDQKTDDRPEPAFSISVDFHEFSEDEFMLKIRNICRIRVPWLTAYSFAETYYRENGHLRVPTNYLVPYHNDSFSLSCWLSRQRTLRANAKDGTSGYSQKRIDMLNAIGMDWTVSSSWEETFAAYILPYYEEFGDLSIPSSYRPDDFCAAKWLERMRLHYWHLLPPDLTEDQVLLLNQCEMDWRLHSRAYQWKEMADKVEAFIRENGFFPPATGDTKPLYRWLYYQKMQDKASTLSAHEKARLDAILKLVRFPKKFIEGMIRLQAVLFRYSDLEHADSSDPDVKKTLSFIDYQIAKYRKNLLTPSMIEALQKNGVILDKERERNHIPEALLLTLCNEFFETHGHLRIPYIHVVNDEARGIRSLHLGRKMAKIRKEGRSSVSPETAAALDAMHFEWDR